MLAAYLGYSHPLEDNIATAELALPAYQAQHQSHTPPALSWSSSHMTAAYNQSPATQPTAVPISSAANLGIYLPRQQSAESSSAHTAMLHPQHQAPGQGQQQPRARLHPTLSFTAIAAASDFAGKPAPSWPGHDETGMEAHMARVGIRRARSFASDGGAFGEAMQASEPRSSPSHARTPSGSSIVSAGPASPFDESISHPHIVSENDADSSPLEELASLSDHSHSKYHHRRRSQARALPTPSHTPLRSSFCMSDVDHASHLSEGRLLTVNSDAATPPPPKIPRLSLANCDGSADDVSTSAASFAPPRNGQQHLLPRPPPPSAMPLTPVTANGDVPDSDLGAQHSSAETAVDAWLKQGPYSHGVSPMRSTIPKLFRSATDAIEDELFAPDADASPPSMPPASAQQQQQQQQQQLQCSSHNNNPNLLMPDRRVLSERMHAANQARMLEAHAASLHTAQPLSRGRSPFRQGSPHAPRPLNSFDDPSPFGQFSSGQHTNTDTMMLGASRAGEDAAAAATISPREALLDFHPDDAGAFTPLFAPLHSPPAHSEASSPESDAYEEQQQASPQHASPAPLSLTPPSAAFTFGASLAGPHGNLQVPQRYPFVPRTALVSEHSINQLANATPEFPAQLISMESSMDQSEDHSGDYEHLPAQLSPAPASTPHAAAAPSPPVKQEFPRPDDTAADTGTFTCTYHGCTLRFETPAKLQRHKREAHRHAGHARHGSADSTGTSGGTGPTSMSMGMGMTSAAVASATGNGQAGPHRCDRINPSTGRRCDTVFSRPYDLTRHEDTIHNARKTKARCQYCTTEEKTFSRRDALTRHMRLVHPEIEFGVRSRRNRLHH